MEVIVPSPRLRRPPPSLPLTTEFNVDSNCSSPYMTAPSSPHKHGNFFFPSDHDHEDNFEFSFGGNLETISDFSIADELFHCGKIKTMPNGTIVRSQCTCLVEEETLVQITEKTISQREATVSEDQYQRCGRRTSVRKIRRSLSAMRISDIGLGDQEDQNLDDSTRSTATATNAKSPSNYVSNFLSSISFSKGYHKKWKLKDLLLFRSASEGRASNYNCDHHKTALTLKYQVLSKKEVNSVTEDAKTASFRSMESIGNSRRRSGGPPLSAHEIHYTANRAIAEELKRKTFLPYKQGLLGCIGFNPCGLGPLPRG